MSLSKMLSHLLPKNTPQSEPVSGIPMVLNSAGGYTFELGIWDRLDRFLILGTEGGTYYASERALTLDNAKALRRCIKEDGPRAVARITEISKAGRAPKNGPAILALALAAESGTDATKTAAYRAVPDVCRTGTHLFEFAAAKKEMGGAFGAGMRRAIGRWYTDKSPEQLAYQVVKYRNRSGFTHRDLLRLARPNGTPETDAILRWCVRGREGLGEVTKAPSTKSSLPARSYGAAGALPSVIAAFDELQWKAATDSLSTADAVRYVTEHRLPWECLPSEMMTQSAVWKALLPTLPMTALVRNLANMTRSGVLTPFSDGERIVCERLSDVERIRKARLHPLAILLALKTYSAGKGHKSNATWTPNQKVVDALNDAFYLAFQTVKPSGKRFLLALDVSGSMGTAFIANSTLSAREASAAMALVTQATEPSTHLVGFTTALGGGYGGQWDHGLATLSPIPVTPRMRLDAACEAIAGMPMGGTDCALPMIYAKERKIPVDVFVIYTDNETWAGKIHPFMALKEYRQAMGIPAKLAVVGMTSTGFTIADPSDAGMLDVVGFDTATPGLLSWFASGQTVNEAEMDEGLEM
jgi:60 kDa SS-A/Ro ribonucleoprotein